MPPLAVVIPQEEALREKELTKKNRPQMTFDWVRSGDESAFDVASATIASEAISDYNWDVALNGYCSQFYPTGIFSQREA